jgi:hypothetical protein
MSVKTESASRPAPAAATAGVGRMRFASLAVLVLLVVEYGTGMYVNLYVGLPGADHGGSIGTVLSNGPVAISVHVVIGLLLTLGALAVLVQSIMARRWGVVALSAVGVFAMVFASVAGTSFSSTGDVAGSMAMAVMTGVALLCYALNLYLLRPGPTAAEPPMLSPGTPRRQ